MGPLAIKKGDFFSEGIDFIRESLSNFQSQKWKFSVLHAVMGVEMVLKEKLVSINPGLALNDIDNPKSRFTVSLRNLILRFESLNIELSQSEQKLILKIVGWRNEIAHHRAAFTEREATESLGSVYRFFTTFSKEQMQIDVKDYLKPEEYQSFKTLLKDRDALVAEAQLAASAEINGPENKLGVLGFDCPACFASGTISIRDSLCFCHCCDRTMNFTHCAQCDKPVAIYGDAEEFPDIICSDCALFI